MDRESRPSEGARPGGEGPGALRWFFGGAAAAALLVVTLLVGVDAYRVWGTPDVRGFNACKPFAKKWMRMAKRYQLARRQPRAVVMGTSRTLTGIALDHPLLARRRPFAVALVAATPHETAEMFALAARESPVELAVLGVEYSRWVSDAEDRAGFEVARLAPRPTVGGWPLPTLDDALAAGLSWQALAASVRTLWRNRDAPPPLETLGSPARWQRDTPEHASWRLRTVEMFHFKQRETARHAKRYGPHVARSWERNRAFLAQILDTAAAAGVRLEVFVSPCHARYFETLARSGHRARYEAWLRDVTELIDAHPARARLWDFGGYTPFTTERGPTAARPSVRMRWYWDTSHFTPELGDKLLDAMLGEGEEAEQEAREAGLGLRLRPADLPRHLRSLREARGRWRAGFADEAADVASIVSELGAGASPDD